MPHEAGLTDSAKKWLYRASSDLALAREGRVSGVLLEDLCFHAQQAVEKSLKSILVNNGIEPPRTHNIKALIELLPAEMDIPDFVQESSTLSDYAVMARYPGEYEVVHLDEYLKALEIAVLVFEWTGKTMGMEGHSNR